MGDQFKGIIKRNKFPEDVDYRNVSNADITISSIINVPLWNIYGWKGVLFLASPYHKFAPVLSFSSGKET